jgi:hypothetical protein
MHLNALQLQSNAENFMIDLRRAGVTQFCLEQKHTTVSSPVKLNLALPHEDPLADVHRRHCPTRVVHGLTLTDWLLGDVAANDRTSNAAMPTRAATRGLDPGRGLCGDKMTLSDLGITSIIIQIICTGPGGLAPP